MSKEQRKPRGELTCQRCGYRWTPNGDGNPKACPNCKNYGWRTPRQYPSRRNTGKEKSQK